jgi:hypothetical protein
MDDYVKNILDDSDERHGGAAVTPTNENLFDINSNSPLINKQDSQFFHTSTAKLLFLAKRARPDILTAVAFLTIRVKRVPIVKNMDGRKSGLSGLKNISSYCKKHGWLEIHGHSKNHSMPKSTKFIELVLYLAEK